MMQPDTSKGYQLSFKVFHAGGLTREAQLSVDSITIGRAGTNVITLDDDRVADLHAVIKLTKDRKLVLTDMDSDEGTYVDGKRVDTRVQLEPGSRIKVGPFDIELDLVELVRRAESRAVTQAVAAALTPAAVHDQTDSELDRSAEQVIDLLFDAWDSHDRLGVDNKQAGRVLEVFEVWGDTILSARQFPKTQPTIRLAEDHASKPDFFVPREYLPGASTSLIAQVNGVMHLCFGEKYEGRLYQGGQEFPLGELIRSGLASKGSIPDVYFVPLTDDSRFVVKLGHIVLTGAFSYPAKKPAAAGSIDVDAQFLSLLMVIALIMGSGALYMRSLPAPPEMTIEDVPDRLAQIIAPKKEEKKKEEKKIEEKKVTKATPTPPPEEKPAPDKGKKDTKAKLAKGDKVAIDQAKKDKEIAENSGLLNDLKKSGNILGAGLDENIKNNAGLLGTTGNSALAMATGSRNIGFSGGGTGGGIGGIGTKGGDGGDGDGGYGDTRGRHPKKAITAPPVETGDAMVLGALDKSLIDKVIREHINVFQYCYALELNKNPRLQGKVVVKFTIDKDGHVSASNIKDSTMSNASVDACVNKRIQQLNFPEPKGGGIVIVSYPFIFRAAG